MDRILFIDKPKGITSFDVIRELRKKLGVKKIGHAGTLDPLASGLLIVGVERGTKELKKFEGLPKTYLIEVLIGKRTDTGDLEGRMLEEKQVENLDIKRVKEVLKEMEGTIELPVPLYSAVKIKGRPLYKLARKGVNIEPPKRKRRIFYLSLKDFSLKNKKAILKVEMKCERGTYARSVAEEIGKRLGYPATVKDLRRTKIGDYSVEKAKKLEDFAS